MTTSEKTKAPHALEAQEICREALIEKYAKGKEDSIDAVRQRVARALAAQGADLRLLVRSSSDLRNIQELQAERVVGDLRDAASLKKAVAGCDVEHGARCPGRTPAGRQHRTGVEE